MNGWVVGVDEAGRGPLAGPVAVGVVMAPSRFNIKKHFPGVADSKKLSPKKREALYTLLLAAARKGQVSFTVEFSSASLIDKVGLTKAISQAINRGVSRLTKNQGPSLITVLLDGGLRAPAQYKQKTIIRGDANEPIISLASIAAKVTRDRLMCTFAKKFPNYGFDIHKGYGTKKHLTAVNQFGLCAIHRRTFKIGKSA